MAPLKIKNMSLCKYQIGAVCGVVGWDTVVVIERPQVQMFWDRFPKNIVANNISAF